jgi:ABC-type nitrate/sulfonate/bicarbonate transport system substrate-binding protein
MMRRRGLALIVLLLCAAVLGASGCAPDDVVDGSGDASLTIAIYAPSLFSASLFVARDKGYFEDEGLSIEFKECESGAVAVEELLAGNVDLACAADYVLASAGLKHPELRAVTELFTTTTLIKLVAREDSGIRGAADLAGMKVGTSEGTAGHYYLEQSLAVKGISPDDVDIAFMSPTDLVVAMGAGELDAASIWEPVATQISDSLGSDAVSLDGQAGQRLYFLLIGDDQWLNTHGDSVEAVLSALIRAERYSFESRAETVELVAKATGQSTESLSTKWDEFHAGVFLTEGLRAALASELDWLGLTQGAEDKAPVTSLSLIHFLALEKAAPDAISVLR